MLFYIINICNEYILMNYMTIFQIVQNIEICYAGLHVIHIVNANLPGVYNNIIWFKKLFDPPSPCLTFLHKFLHFLVLKTINRICMYTHTQGWWNRGGQGGPGHTTFKLGMAKYMFGHTTFYLYEKRIIFPKLKILVNFDIKTKIDQPKFF